MKSTIILVTAALVPFTHANPFARPGSNALLARASPTPDASCVCEEVMCIAQWPQSCFCENAAKQACYDKCGGSKPVLQSCPGAASTSSVVVAASVTSRTSTSTTTSRASTTSSSPSPSPTQPSKDDDDDDDDDTCECEETVCIQKWPDSCLCANAAKKKCWKDCGSKGPEPKYQVCIPDVDAIRGRIRSMNRASKAAATIAPPSVTSSSPTSTTTTATSTTNQACGGFVPSPVSCPAGQVCIDDPFDTTGCGMACDAPGICAGSTKCGGFLGLSCPSGQTCVDDPTDSCDPKKGGADCMGLCVWKPISTA